jgi:RNA-directed DNA polymerase
MNVIAATHLPRPTIVHPWPEHRFLVKHRRQEPDA